GRAQLRSDLSTRRTDTKRDRRYSQTPDPGSNSNTRPVRVLKLETEARHANSERNSATVRPRNGYATSDCGLRAKKSEK
ncbi:hypothetical protein PSTG_18521, partial [Puccinia striiformis f. sp. tritici PST-78]